MSSLIESPGSKGQGLRLFLNMRACVRNGDVAGELSDGGCGVVHVEILERAQPEVIKLAE